MILDANEDTYDPKYGLACEWTVYDGVTKEQLNYIIRVDTEKRAVLSYKTRTNPDTNRKEIVVGNSVAHKVGEIAKKIEVDLPNKKLFITF